MGIKGCTSPRDPTIWIVMLRRSTPEYFPSWSYKVSSNVRTGIRSLSRCGTAHGTFFYSCFDSLCALSLKRMSTRPSRVTWAVRSDPWLDMYTFPTLSEELGSGSVTCRFRTGGCSLSVVVIVEQLWVRDEDGEEPREDICSWQVHQIVVLLYLC
jgi:hypothetical protein